MSIKNNWALPNNHFNKSNKKYKMWFNQSIKKSLRIEKREQKAKNLYPLPLKELQPVVRCQSQRYNYKQKLGRGFTCEEVIAAGVESITEARELRIRVDSRRKNKSQESFNENVLRIKEYISKLKFFDTKESAIDNNVEQIKGTIMPIKKSDGNLVEFIDAKKISSFSV